MTGQALSTIASVTRATGVLRPVAAIAGVTATGITLSRLPDGVSLGDRILLPGPAGGVHGEIVGLSDALGQVMPEGSTDGLRVGGRAICLGPATIAPDDSWIGRMIDSLGRPLDGRPLVQGAATRRGLSGPPPDPAQRRGLGARSRTGLRLFNTLLPIARGQRIGIFSGSGVGKSTLLGTFASDLDADVVVIALVGERGREVGDFLRYVLGANGLARSVVVVETSDRPGLARRRAAETAMTVAEHFRDAGAHVLLMVDSVTRLAEAHREIAASAGELPAVRGYPPSLVPVLASLSERAGPGAGGQGDITAVFTVLVAGSDHDEPVADTMRGLLDGHVVLSRAIAEEGRFPAVDILRSVSRSLPRVATDRENFLIGQTRAAFATLERADAMLRTGLYQAGSDPVLDRAVACRADLETFLAERASGSPEDCFDRLAAIFDAADAGTVDGVKPASA